MMVNFGLLKNFSVKISKRFKISACSQGKKGRKQMVKTISLCMIMFDEAEVLERCLKSAKGLWDELIIVDTGSKDKSIEVAESFGAQVIRAQWLDDFALVRNIGLKKATGDWIFILDPDEVICPRDIPEVREYTKSEKVVVYQFKTRNYTNNPYLLNYVPNRFEYEEGKGFRGYAESNKARLFKNHIGLTFEGIIHEMVDYQAFRRKLEGRNARVPIHHYQDVVGKTPVKKKAFFMLRICEKKVESSPHDAKAWWELGISQTLIGYNARAVESMRRSMELAPVDAEKMITLGLTIDRTSRKGEGQRYLEKGICIIHPELTHIKKEYKKPLK